VLAVGLLALQAHATTYTAETGNSFATPAITASRSTRPSCPSHPSWCCLPAGCWRLGPAPAARVRTLRTALASG